MDTLPESGGSSRASALTSVVLPLPLGPITTVILPGVTAMSTPSNARTSRNVFVRAVALSIGEASVFGEITGEAGLQPNRKAVEREADQKEEDCKGRVNLNWLVDGGAEPLGDAEELLNGDEASE